MIKKIINRMSQNLNDNYIYYSEKLKDYLETKKFVKKCTKKEKWREWQRKANTEKIKRLAIQRELRSVLMTKPR